MSTKREAWNANFEEEVSFEQLDPASPNARKMGVPLDNKDTINSNTRMDPEEYGKLKHIIEHNLDPRFGNMSEFVRHYVAYGISETLRRSRDQEYSRLYEASLHQRAVIEQAKEIAGQFKFIDEIEVMWNKSGFDLKVFELMEDNLRGWIKNAATPKIVARLKGIFPQLNNDPT